MISLDPLATDGAFLRFWLTSYRSSIALVLTAPHAPLLTALNLRHTPLQIKELINFNCQSCFSYRQSIERCYRYLQ
jgi:hypothetical protein